MIRLDDNADTFPVGLQGTPFETVYKALRAVAATVWNVDPTAYRAGMAWGWYALYKPEALVGFRDIATAALISAFAPLVKDSQTDEELVEYLRLWRSYIPTFPKLQALYALFGLTVNIQPISDPESQAILPVDDTRLAFYIRIESVDFSRPMSLGEVHDLAVRATPLGSRPYPYYALETHIDVPTAAISEECGVMVGDSGIVQLPPMDLILVDDATGRVTNGGMFGDALELAAVQVSHVLVQPACDAIMQGVQIGTVQLDPQVDVELVDVAAFPTVTVSERWLVLGANAGDASGSNVTIQANGTRAGCWWDDGSSSFIASVYDNSVVYAIIRAAKTPWALVTRVGLPVENVGGAIGVRNLTGASISVYQAEYAYCDNLSATVITVYNASNVAYSAFMYTHPLYGADYYYVLDGVQTDWTDDLDSIGYRLLDSLEVFFYLKTDYSKDTFSANDYWASVVIDETDKAALQAFGVTVSTINGRDVIGRNQQDVTFSFEPIGLYSGVREGDLQADMSNFYCADGPNNPDSPYYGLCIKSINAYSTSSKTWKCRITRNS